MIIWIINLTEKKLGKSRSNSQRFKHAKYTVVIIFAVLLISDLGIRLVTTKYDSYSEKNYGLFYISPFSDGFSILKHKYYYGREITELNTHPANTTVNFKTSDFEFAHIYNELGLRERKNLISEASDKIVILTIGDSFTEGVGTRQDSTWQLQLEGEFNKLSDSNYIVINAGISGYDPLQELNLLKALSDKIKPNIVILSLSSNDIMDLVIRHNNKETAKNNLLKPQPTGYYFYSWSYIFRAITAVVYDYPEIYMNQKELDDEIEKSTTKIKEVITEICAIGEKNDFETIVILFPDAGELSSGKFKYNSIDELSELCKANNIQSINLLEIMTKKMSVKKYNIEELYWKTDGHLTPKAYSFWSEILLSYFIEKRLIANPENN